jgi:hypothetical protein
MDARGDDRDGMGRRRIGRHVAGCPPVDLRRVRHDRGDVRHILLAAADIAANREKTRDMAAAAARAWACRSGFANARDQRHHAPMRSSVSAVFCLAAVPLPILILAPWHYNFLSERPADHIWDPTLRIALYMCVYIPLVQIVFFLVVHAGFALLARFFSKFRPLKGTSKNHLFPKLEAFGPSRMAFIIPKLPGLIKSMLPDPHASNFGKR